MSGDRATVREFLLKYQDRVTYGTDNQVGNGDDARLWESHSQRIEGEWRYFASDGEITSRNRQVQGLGLPEPVLRKVFNENARRWFPGIAPNAAA